MPTFPITPTDPPRLPANFHLRNGAALHQINYLGDTTPNKGIEGAYGFMCNYLYEPERMEDRATEYADLGTVATTGNLEGIAASL